MGRYRRTVSFPNPPSLRPSPSAAGKSYHVRSASLPCNRAHPLIPQLRDELAELRFWATSKPDSSTQSGSGRVCEGLARLKGVLDSFDDVLQLPQTQDSLSSSASRLQLVENLLEDFLRFVDVYGIFQASVLALKQELSGAQVAIRRKDASKLGLHVKAQRKIANEIGKLVSTVGSISEQPIPCTLAAPDRHPEEVDNDISHEDLRVVIRDVHRLTASVSAGIFSGVSGSFGPVRRPVWAGLGLGRRPRKDDEGMIEEFQEVNGEVENLMFGLRRNNKGSSSSSSSEELEEQKRMKNEEMRIEVLKRVQEVEDCVGEMERESERVFRSLISTRVSLLNILTHA